MTEPGYPKGTWTKHAIDSPYAHLVPGKRYKVIKPFTDFDRNVHPVGESWIYLGTSFLPYDDGRSIFVSTDGEHERHIRMQDRKEEQRAILDALQEYVVEA